MSLTPVETWWNGVQQETDTEPGNIRLKGQVIHLRKISKRLFFFDLRINFGEEGLKLEVIVKFDEVSLEGIASLYRQLHVGDLVVINGWMEVQNMLFHCLDVERVDRYTGENPFIPEAPIIPKKFDVEKSGKLCKYWLSSGKCQLGDNCPFTHIIGSQEDKNLIRTKWVAERLLERRIQACSTLDPHSPSLKKSGFHRARVFADWLLEKFTPEFLSSGSGVLDIAGGRGEISFNLQTISGVKCTLIEPREMKINRKQKKILDRGNNGGLEGSLVGSMPNHIRENFDSSFIESQASLIQNASILIGMHPDQVTELIARTAIAHNKPFAIVPCCVFGHLFPNRITSNGEQVIGFEEFVSYLNGLSDNICQEYLNFGGRNLVLWKVNNKNP